MPRVIHFEILADDPERAIGFYHSVFGWEFTRWKDAEYWLIRTGESDQPGIDGGLVRRKVPVDGAGTTAYVSIIAVANLDRYLMKVRTSGGGQVGNKTAIGGVGWLAYCKDTEGNTFGMMQTDPEAR